MPACFANALSDVDALSGIRVPPHRLNRAEYNATVRDLLPTTSTPADAFPADAASVNGLDNMASDLSISPTLFADYEQAARDLAAEIVDPQDTNTTPPVYGPAHAKWMTCDPNNSEPDACAQRIITAFATSAWRRPLSAHDAANLMVLWRAQTFTWSANLKTVLAAILLSPRFLFRLEEVSGTGVVALDGYQVANRLSYFLWSSMPDDALMAAATSGALLTTEGILAQTQRMLADPKAAALGTNFAAQWLNTRYLPNVTPDPKVYPGFNPNIAQDMAEETRAFFNFFLSTQIPVQTMLVANYTYANDELASFYGLTPPGASTPMQVSTPNRYGLLTLGAWLTVTSMPNRTSPTKRGAWILTQLMCQTPPQVPAGVNTTLPTDNSNTTVRQQMSAHDTNPSCAACHALIDPLGLGLENFTGVGQYRSAYTSQPIDASGTLPGGMTFQGPNELAQLLSQDPRFVACLSSRLFAYATGTLPTSTTQPIIDSVTTEWATKNYTLPSLIETIVTSPAFRTRLVESP